MIISENRNIFTISVLNIDNKAFITILVIVIGAVVMGFLNSRRKKLLELSRKEGLENPQMSTPKQSPTSSNFDNLELQTDMGSDIDNPYAYASNAGLGM